MSFNDNDAMFPLEVRNDTEKTIVQFSVNELITNLHASAIDTCTCGSKERQLARALLRLAHKCQMMADYCVEKSLEAEGKPLVCTVINTAPDKRCEARAVATLKMTHKPGGLVHGFHACEFHAEKLREFAKSCNMNLEYTTLENESK